MVTTASVEHNAATTTTKKKKKIIDDNAPAAARHSNAPAMSSRSIELEQTYVHDVYTVIAANAATRRRISSSPISASSASSSSSSSASSSLSSLSSLATASPFLQRYIRRFIADSFEPGSIVLDVGCGDGRYLDLDRSSSSSKKNLITMVGFEYCAEWFRNTSLYPRTATESSPGTALIVGDVRRLPFRDESFDGTLCVDVLHHLAAGDRRVDALKEMVRVLKIGGKMLITVSSGCELSDTVESQDVLIPVGRADLGDNVSGSIASLSARPNSGRHSRNVSSFFDDASSSTSTDDDDEDHGSSSSRSRSSSSSSDTSIDRASSSNISFGSFASLNYLFAKEAGKNHQHCSDAHCAYENGCSSPNGSSVASEPIDNCYTFVKKALKRFSLTSGGFGASASMKHHSSSSSIRRLAAARTDRHKCHSIIPIESSFSPDAMFPIELRNLDCDDDDDNGNCGDDSTDHHHRDRFARSSESYDSAIGKSSLARSSSQIDSTNNTIFPAGTAAAAAASGSLLSVIKEHLISWKASLFTSTLAWYSSIDPKLAAEAILSVARSNTKRHRHHQHYHQHQHYHHHRRHHKNHGHHRRHRRHRHHHHHQHETHLAREDEKQTSLSLFDESFRDQNHRYHKSQRYSLPLQTLHPKVESNNNLDTRTAIANGNGRFGGSKRRHKSNKVYDACSNGIGEKQPMLSFQRTASSKHHHHHYPQANQNQPKLSVTIGGVAKEVELNLARLIRRRLSSPITTTTTTTSTTTATTTNTTSNATTTTTTTTAIQKLSGDKISNFIINNNNDDDDLNIDSRISDIESKIEIRRTEQAVITNIDDDDDDNEHNNASRSSRAPRLRAHRPSIEQHHFMSNKKIIFHKSFSSESSAASSTIKNQRQQLRNQNHLSGEREPKKRRHHHHHRLSFECSGYKLIAYYSMPELRTLEDSPAAATEGEQHNRNRSEKRALSIAIVEHQSHPHQATTTTTTSSKLSNSEEYLLDDCADDDDDGDQMIDQSQINDQMIAIDYCLNTSAIVTGHNGKNSRQPENAINQELNQRIKSKTLDDEQQPQPESTVPNSTPSSNGKESNSKFAKKLRRQRSFSADYQPEVAKFQPELPRRFSASPNIGTHRYNSSCHTPHMQQISVDSEESSFVTIIPADPGGVDASSSGLGGRGGSGGPSRDSSSAAATIVAEQLTDFEFDDDDDDDDADQDDDITAAVRDEEFDDDDDDMINFSQSASSASSSSSSSTTTSDDDDDEDDEACCEHLSNEHTSDDATSTSLSSVLEPPTIRSAAPIGGTGSKSSDHPGPNMDCVNNDHRAEEEEAEDENENRRRILRESSGCRAPPATLHRYYHLFRGGELQRLIEQHVQNLHIIDSFYDECATSWCVVVEKIHVWTI